MDSRRWAQLFTIVLSFASGLGLSFHTHWLGKNRTNILIAPIVYFFHVAFYYIAVNLSASYIDLDKILFGIDIGFHWWSVGVTIHSIITILFLSYAAIKSYK
jgi:hypothetical protein